MMTAHEKTTLSYRPNREANEQIIRMLCEHYPKCFFEDSRQRRPLKQKIVTDIISDQDLDVSPELITAAVDWYKSNIGYEGFAMSIPGAKRIDLNGNEVGTVTEQEALAAQQRLDDFHREKNAQSPVRVVRETQPHPSGLPDPVVRKLDTPAAVPAPRSKAAPAAAAAPEFAPLYETLANANAAVVGISDPTMRAVVVRATLDVVSKKLEQVRSELG
jgi:sRNA-binding protein